MRHGLCLICGLLLSVQGTALGVTARSTFTDSLNGWTLDGAGALVHEAAGGQSGGRARFNDGSDEPVQAPDERWIIAPAAFLGDWLDLEAVGSLSWQQIILHPGEGGIPLVATAVISGPAGSAVYQSANYVSLSWQTFSVPIAAASWQVTGSWAALLANVTDLRIRIEGVVNTAGTLRDSCALDNVVLAAPGQVIYVDHGAEGACTGATWPDAFCFLQEALTVAKTGDQVWVAAGRYAPAGPSGDRSLSFVLPPAVQLHGGFAGTEDPETFDLEDRDLVAHETVLTGDLNGDDGPGFVNYAENSYHVVMAFNRTPSSGLDGFTISGGNANGVGSDGRGGGLLLDNSTCGISRCRFVDNWGNNGGAISAWTQSHAPISQCDFLRNGALLGAGLYCSNSSPVLRQCILVGNVADSGGGLYADQGSPTFTNCILSGNQAAQDGGAIRNLNTSSPQLINCTLAGNAAGSRGGGLASRQSCFPQIRNSILWGNTVNGSATQAAQLQLELNSNYTVSYSCIQGSWPGTGNVAMDPQFLDADGADNVVGTEDDDLRLAAGSPAIDAGNNASVSPGVTEDVAGRPRFLDDATVPDTGSGTPPIVDLGAHEYVPVFLLSGIPLMVPEGGTTDFTVALSDDPGEPVEITVTRVAGDADITVAVGTALAFDSSNWWTPQTVTLAAAEDLDFANGEAWIEIEGAAVGAMVVAATEVDNDLPPAVLYVDQIAGGANDGTSWADAFTELRDALAALESLDAPQVEIWVSEGIHKPAPLGGARTQTFRLRSGIEIYGGFEGASSVNYPGGEAEREQRDPGSNLTVLSGDLNGDDGPNWTSMTDNSYRLVDASGADATAVLDGFVITGGNGNGGSPYNFGGGLYAVAGSPVIRRCSFVLNRASWGGGAYFATDSSPLLDSCRFIGNRAYSGRGGAVYTQIDGYPVLVNCLLSGNTANAEGGALHCRTRTELFLYNCTLSANSATSLSGGIYAESPLRIWNSILWNNAVGSLVNQETQIYRTTTYQITYSCVEGWTGSLGGVGNMGISPQFESPLGGDGLAGTLDDDLRLGPGSPCIDAGRNSDVPGWVTTDVAGSPRYRDDPSVVDTGSGTPPIVDMGAFEAPPRQGVLVTDDPVYVPEGSTASFGVALSMDPGEVVEVSVALGDGDTDITVQSGVLLTFDSGNWADWQTVVLAAAPDADFANGTVIVEITSHATWPRDVLAVEVDSAPFPAVVYVDGQADGDETGLNWADAFVQPQDAVEAILSRPDRPSGAASASIWVAQGVYKPTAAGGDRTVSFDLYSNVALYGGFAGGTSLVHPGGETELGQRDAAANPTVLSGDLNGNDGPGFANNGENSYHVIEATGVGTTAILDGFVIMGGNADGDTTAGYNRGGGLYASGGSPTIRDCLFKGNVASSTGGGIALLNPSVPVFDRCIFRANRAAIGGAVFINRVQPVFANCLLSGNQATLDGGALYATHAGTILTMVNCTITANSGTRDGGGLRVVSAPIMKLANSILWDNHLNGSVDEDSQLSLQTYTSANYQINHCRIQGWTGGLGGIGNSGQNPQFQDSAGFDEIAGTADDDLTLAPGSPCIDAGRNSDVPGWVTLDLVGEPRFQEDPSAPNTGVGTPPLVDIGAYEMPPRQGAVVAGVPVHVPEGGTADFTVALAMDPGQPHTLTIAYHAGDEDITIQSGAELTFDSSDWSVPQTVTLAAAVDAPHWANGRTVFRITSDAIWTREVTAWEVDQDAIPAQIYVDPSATGGENAGTSWTDAFLELRDALEAVENRPGVEEIWVAKGTYRPAPAGGARSISFMLIDGVGMYGGFGGLNSVDYPGGETEREQRQPRKNITVLSGDVAGDDVGDLDDPTRGENSYHVVTAEAVSLSAVLDGFTITGGNANALNYPILGGGLHLYQASPTIRDCRVIANQASNGGGGMYMTLNSHPTITQCRFIQNRATTTGGGLYLNNTCHPTVLNCLFIGNTSLDGGGVRNHNKSNPNFINCVFSGNSTTRYGGGFYSTTNSQPVVVNGTFAGNYAPTGGGIANRSSTSLTLTNCILWGNQNIDGTGQSAQLFEETVSTPAEINYTCMQGWTGSYGGLNNISLDPLFIRADGPDGLVGTEDDDLRLSDDSPCIDAGNTAVVPPGVSTDADGSPRLNLDAVDMGAYEYNEEGAVQLLRAFSRRVHGTAGAFEVDLVRPLPPQTRSVEPRQGGPVDVLVDFSRPVFGVGGLDPSDVIVIASSGGGGITDLSIDDRRLALTLSGIADRTAVRVAFPGIEDGAGNVVDDTLCFNVLAGDVDGNSTANIFDLVRIRNELNSTVSPSSFRADVAPDGVVNVLDLVVTRNNLNHIVTQACP